MGGITKSLAELIATATLDATPGSTDTIIYSPTPNTPLVTQCKRCTIADLAAAVVPVIAAGRVVFGTGTGITGSADFTYDDTTKKITLNGGAIGFVADRNVIVGVGALAALTTGDDNIAIGAAAGDAITTGVNNLAIGSDAAGATSSGGNNVAIGLESLLSNTGSSFNVAIGSSALRLVDAARNIGIGAFAGQTITSGQRNIAIGTDATVTSATADDQLVIGDSAAANYFIKGNLTEIAVAPIIRGNGGFKSSDGSAGETAVILAAGLVSITVKNGLVTAHA